MLSGTKPSGSKSNSEYLAIPCAGLNLRKGNVECKVSHLFGSCRFYALALRTGSLDKLKSFAALADGDH